MHLVHAQYSPARSDLLASMHAQPKGDQGDKHEHRQQTFLAPAGDCGGRPGRAGAPGPGPGSPQIRAHRLGHRQDRPQRRRHGRHRDAQLPAVGQGDQCRGRHHAQGLRQARAHRSRGIRRPLQHRRGRARHRAPDDPGQGGLRAAALEHGQQPGRGPDLRKAQIPAAGRDLGDRQGTGAGQALGPRLLLPGHGFRLRRSAGGLPGDGQEGRQDRQQDRHDQHRRRLWRGAGQRHPQGRQAAWLRAGLRQELSHRHAGHDAHPDRGQEQERRRLHRLLLPARHHADHRAVARQRPEPQSDVHRRGHAVPDVQGQVRRGHRRHHGPGRRGLRRPGDQGLLPAPQGIGRP